MRLIITFSRKSCLLDAQTGVEECDETCGKDDMRRGDAGENEEDTKKGIV